MLPEPPGYLKQVMGYGGIWSRTGESTIAYSSTVVIIVVYSLEFFVAEFLNPSGMILPELVPQMRLVFHEIHETQNRGHSVNATSWGRPKESLLLFFAS